MNTAAEFPLYVYCSPGKGRLTQQNPTICYFVVFTLSLPPKEQLNMIIMTIIYYQSSHLFSAELSNLHRFPDDSSLQLYEVTDEKTRVQSKVMLLGGERTTSQAKIIWLQRLNQEIQEEKKKSLSKLFSCPQMFTKNLSTYPPQNFPITFKTANYHLISEKVW